MRLLDYWPWMKSNEARVKMLACVAWIHLYKKVKEDRLAKEKAREKARMAATKKKVATVSAVDAFKKIMKGKNFSSVILENSFFLRE